MKKVSLSIILLCVVLMVKAQIGKPTSISVSYFGEMVTHPGLKLGVNYDLKNWTKTTKKEKIITKKYIISPAVGFYYHKRYQTGLFFIPEISCLRQTKKGFTMNLGLGIGYMHTFIPNSYVVGSDGSVNAVTAGNNYFVSNYFVSFGKDLSVKHDLAIGYFIKPQYMFALPNFPNGVGYFALELGVNFKLR